MRIALSESSMIDRRAVPGLRGGRSRYSSRRMRRTRCESSASRTELRVSKTASTISLCMARAVEDYAEFGADRDQGGRPLSPYGRAGRVWDNSAAPLPTSPPPTRPKSSAKGAGLFGDGFDEIFRARRAEADEFYASITRRRWMRTRPTSCAQAFGGDLLWSKQFYHYDVDKWLEERGSGRQPLPGRRGARRHAQLTTGTTCTTATSSRCPTSGNTPGTQPGTSPST